VAPFTVSFDASSSFDPDGQIASYHWILADGQTQEPKAASGRTLSHTYDTPGTFNITLTVTDDKGKTASVSKTIVVRENLSPTASFSATPTTGEAPLAVAFDASTSADPDGSIISYTWNFGDGASGSRVTTSHTYDTPGTFTITLTVTDDKGKTGFATQTIYVNEPAETPNPDPEPTPPDSGNAIPTASFTASPSSGTAPLSVSFNASSSYDPDGSITSYAWSFGDGATGSGVTTSHIYTTTNNRTYTITLTITDDDGAQATTTETISVEPYTPPPAPTPTPTESFSGSGQQVTALFRLTAGLAIFRMTHTGNSNFIIVLEDDTGDWVELLVNEIGSFNGATSVHIEDTGWFMLDISADGAWTVTIEQ
jgi:PKD repeat protein